MSDVDPARNTPGCPTDSPLRPRLRERLKFFRHLLMSKKMQKYYIATVKYYLAVKHRHPYTAFCKEIGLTTQCR